MVFAVDRPAKLRFGKLSAVDAAKEVVQLAARVAAKDAGAVGSLQKRLPFLLKKAQHSMVQDFLERLQAPPTASTDTYLKTAFLVLTTPDVDDFEAWTTRLQLVQDALKKAIKSRSVEEAKSTLKATHTEGCLRRVLHALWPCFDEVLKFGYARYILQDRLDLDGHR
ncbi:unnamed protein product [Sympodiomycopsis kandeliae]